MNLVHEARLASVGMCAAIEDGRDNDANSLMRMYIAESMVNGFTSDEALMMLVKTTIGTAVSTNVGTQWWVDLAKGLAVRS